MEVDPEAFFKNFSVSSIVIFFPGAAEKICSKKGNLSSNVCSGASGDWASWTAHQNPVSFSMSRFRSMRDEGVERTEGASAG